MPLVQLENVKLNYLLLGPAESVEDEPTLVMVHGLATNLAFWYGIASTLANSYRVLLLDLRGHGRSSMPPSGYSPSHMATDLQELLKTLEIATAVLIGHSFGGAVVLHCALQASCQIERIVLADVRLKQFQPQQQPQDWPHWPQLQKTLATLNIHLAEDEPEAGYRLLVEMARLQVEQPQAVATVQGLSSLYPQGAGLGTVQRWLKLLDTTTAWQEFIADDGLTQSHLQMLQKPTLALYGEHSPTLATGRQLQVCWPHSQLELVSSAGHFFPLSQPQTFIAHLERFLACPHAAN